MTRTDRELLAHWKKVIKAEYFNSTLPAYDRWLKQLPYGALPSGTVSADSIEDVRIRVAAAHNVAAAVQYLAKLKEYAKTRKDPPAKPAHIQHPGRTWCVLLWMGPLGENDGRLRQLGDQTGTVPSSHTVPSSRTVPSLPTRVPSLPTLVPSLAKLVPSLAKLVPSLPKLVPPCANNGIRAQKWSLEMVLPAALGEGEGGGNRNRTTHSKSAEKATAVVTRLAQLGNTTTASRRGRGPSIRH